MFSHTFSEKMSIFRYIYLFLLLYIKLFIISTFSHSLKIKFFILIFLINSCASFIIYCEYQIFKSFKLILS